jgi:2-dehydro-3-deoxygluconokinase
VSRIVCCGEGMLELSRRGEVWRLGYGGDTLNTAIHLARAGHDVAFLSALGTDPLSGELRDNWAAEGLDTSLVLEHPARQVGLYAISANEKGERSFTYWRENSAAREMFSLLDAPGWPRVIEGTELFIFSLISLAILPEQGVASLLRLADLIRKNGGLVAFDGNYRPGLWGERSTTEIRATRDAAISTSDIGLPTFEDEVLLCGAPNVDAVARHWQGLGCAETVVKLGARGCQLPDGSIAAPDEVLDPVDTSGAGDAFNAGYLDSRLAGLGPAAAARAAHRLAAWTILRPGAIPLQATHAEGSAVAKATKEAK